ncbi:hypothetical protein JL100_022180 [Skermanella mucosa]|uniref:hypothetical protein n=1 Tax=Skermanella mucosa TaxID=1789672 RepID=UPI00192CBAED|nr:hypothetical protein [Skermanella mucosa]UEM19769.1 hypothetical protein JL100_022180 [Skermanella mucosa]
MSERVRYIVERFPDLASAVKQYSSDNRFFRGLCEDYGEAVEALLQCESSNNPTDFERADACRELIMDLEREVLIELHRWNDDHGDSA